jgi:hypothetical protein
MFSSSNASSCTLSSAPALWTGTNPAAVNCHGTYSATVPPSSTKQQWTFTFTATNSAGQSTSASQTLTEQPPPFRQSPNWSGYIVPSTSSLITAVSGQWTVPTLNCSVTPNAQASIWVGIGGFLWPTGGTSGVLLQTGVDTDCVSGVQQDNGWFEAYPSNPNQPFVFSGFPVSPGDEIEASVYQWSNGAAWETCIENLTTGLSGLMVTGEAWGVTSGGCTASFAEQGSTAGLSYAGGYTAEWIVEDPGDVGSRPPLADYGTVSFSNLQTSLSPWYLTENEAVEMVQNGVVLSTPSLPSSDGFSVSYTG